PSLIRFSLFPYTTLFRSADENYLVSGGYNLDAGRNFSQPELEFGSNVVIIGSEIKDKLFADEDPLNKSITIGNNQFRVIGLLARSEEHTSELQSRENLVC